MEETKSLMALEVCGVAPTPQTKPTHLDLTFFDVQWLRFSPNQRLFFYKTEADSDLVLSRLKSSLSQTLQDYPVLAGNLVWPPDHHKPIVKYVDGDAVSFTVAEAVEADLDYFLSDDPREVEEFYPFVPEFLDCHEAAPVMSIQVTFFPPNGGFCIGYAIHHAVLDGKSIAMFMHSWASICNVEGGSAPLLPQLAPSYDRSIIKDPCNLEEDNLYTWLKQIGPDNKSLELADLKEAQPRKMFVTFKLSKHDIEDIKEFIHKQWQESDDNNKSINVRLSTFIVIVAYVWVCLVRTQNQTHTKEAYIAINIDCRARLEPPTPPNYFGNCVTTINVSADVSELVRQDGVAIAAKAVGEALEGLKDGVLKDAKNWLSKSLSILGTGCSYSSVAGSPRFQHYKTDFGWGKPSKVQLVSIDKSGAFTILDSKDGDERGVEIGVVLAKEETIFRGYVQQGPSKSKYLKAYHVPSVV